MMVVCGVWIYHRPTPLHGYSMYLVTSNSVCILEIFNSRQSHKNLGNLPLFVLSEAALRVLFFMSRVKPSVQIAVRNLTSRLLLILPCSRIQISGNLPPEDIFVSVLILLKEEKRRELNDSLCSRCCAACPFTGLLRAILLAAVVPPG